MSTITTDAEAFRAGWDDAKRLPGPGHVEDPSMLPDSLRRAYEAGVNEFMAFRNTAR